MSRIQVDKLELQFRDHLVLNLEPMMASFPLEEEGKEILRQKLLSEMNDFMESREIEGKVLDVKIVYVLGN
jgi:flagellar basal body-associated protein FliL